MVETDHTYRGVIAFNTFQLIVGAPTTQEEKNKLRSIYKDDTISELHRELKASLYLMKNDHIIKEVIYHRG